VRRIQTRLFSDLTKLVQGQALIPLPLLRRLLPFGGPAKDILDLIV